jgi:RNA polymerase sigma-70 factor, ECF subfamily
MSRTSRPPTARADTDVVAALRAGDEATFVGLVRAHHPALLAAAMSYVGSRAVAEEVVQETWLGVVSGLERFEGRCSLKTWIFKIAANIARTRGVRERRCLPFSSLGGGEDAGEPAVGPDRFHPDDHPCAGHWARPPRPWDTPEGALLSAETRDVVGAAIARLPPSQRLVVTLRDVEGWSAGETCEALEISAGNQRVLLHRGRCKVRAALERHLERVESAA